MTGRLRWLAALAAIVFLLAHARAMPRTLEDIDSINFALGVESFDVASHQPHPPGYPIYIALAKFSTAAVRAVAPSWDRDRRAAVGLAVWSVIAGALAALVLTRFWIAAGLAAAEAFLSAIVAVVSPLFWFTAARPLSDVPGLVAALAVQTALVRGLLAVRAGGRAPRALLWGALGAGLAVGLRSQTMWINGPALVWAIAELTARRRVADVGRIAALAIAGVLVWLVPLVWDTGGVGAYMRALGSQGAQDLGGIEMLATTPTMKVFARGLRHTFVEPWHVRALGSALPALALVGAVVWLMRRRQTLAIVLSSFAPYLIFHLTFQETATLRYALPIVVPVAACAVGALSMLGLRAAAVGSAVIAAVSLALVQPQLQIYSREGPPIFRAFQDMLQARPAAGEPPMLRMHHQVWHGVRRVMDWYRPIWDVGPQPFPGDREWQDIVSAWKGGDTRPVWFLAELTRTDLRLFDSRSRERRTRYEPAPGVLQLMGNDTRLDGLTWIALRRPNWMLGAGWALTPEIAGVTDADHAWPNEHPAEAYLRRGAGLRNVLIGGRYLAPPGSPPARIAVRLDGQTRQEWIASAAAPWFVRWIELPDGGLAGSGTYATLSVTVASAAPDGRAPLVGLEQFDAAGPDEVMFAFGDDWYELEGNPATGRLWRWSSGRSTLEILGANRDVRLTLAGESPLKYFDRPPVVRVAAGGREIARFSPASDFTETVVIPAAVIASAQGRVTIETDLVWVPGERENSADRRRLGLRLFQVTVTPAQP